MSKATDSIIEAEKMIRNFITGSIEQNRTIDICKKLFLYNIGEHGYIVKCYTRDDKSVRFCIDRGHDCDNDKINTIFLCIKSNFQLGVLSSKEKKSYIKVHDRNWDNISGPIARSLSDKEIYEHVLDSFYSKIDKLGLSGHRSLEKLVGNHDHLQDNNYLPTYKDFESAYRELTCLGEIISIDSVLDQIEINAKKNGRSLKNSWQMITEMSIEIWSGKSCTIATPRLNCGATPALAIMRDDLIDR
jgi:hypothetical protein